MKIEKIWEAKELFCDCDNPDLRTTWDYIRDAINGLDKEEETAVLLTGEFYENSGSWQWACPKTADVFNWKKTLSLKLFPERIKYVCVDGCPYPIAISEHDEEPYEWTIPENWEEFDRKLESSEDFVKDFFREIQPWTLYE